jgi:uridylate kinase
LKVVISLGGSIFSKEDGIDVGYLKEFSREILKVSTEHRIFIVAGGGKAARRFINAGRELGADEDFLDLLGIRATQLNAMVVSSAFGERGIDSIPERIEDVNPSEDRVVVMGGTVPGHSTDAVSAMLAVHVEADLLINATDVDGVYERDPKENPKAKRFEKLSSEELIKIVETTKYRAGASAVIDPKAARIIHEREIKTVIVDGRHVKNITDTINGEFKGTVIDKPR